MKPSLWNQLGVYVDLFLASLSSKSAKPKSLCGAGHKGGETKDRLETHLSLVASHLDGGDLRMTF